MLLEWQPIETAPRDGTKVELWIEAATWHRPGGECYRVREAWWNKNGWTEWNDRDDCDMPVEGWRRDGRWMWRAVLWLPIFPDPSPSQVSDEQQESPK